MGLFSFFNKNKQDRAAEDSGRFYSKDDDAGIAERARSKRASHAGAAPGRRTAADPMLPEKKRARRRLVGAIALALAAAVGLPMMLDSSPKPLTTDIAIQIPSKDKAAPLPVPAAPAPVSSQDSIDKDEEIVSAPSRPEPKAQTRAEPAVDARSEQREARVEPKPERKAETKPEHKSDPKPEHKPEHKADTRVTEKEKPARARTEDKPAKPSHEDAARALAILEDKQAARERAASEKAEKADRADKADKADRAAEGAGQKVTLQVAAMSSQEKAAELQARLRGAGISSHTEKFGDLIRVKVGPISKDDADRVRAKLGKLGL